ncbi:ISNCY family transposase [Thermotalea metallivorans]|uniref:Transposase InsH N-terminal domain-containing protein n=1 Tax=Thermotalea metallivorans TaxID=520762 RepID=A0A140LA81_9FIRM|nr:ISNCY family transposase [Thermotalea metallivorans]KXG77456.1 hypothetical protein AN619_04740 [Thermotalea metallivorans]
MLKLREPQLTLWDSILPEEIRKLPDELAKIDAILDDERFMKPFLEKHNTHRGRPTVPIETFLRLMYLKHRYGFGFETLVQEVGDSITWRMFCRIPLDEKMPDPTTLMKACKRYGDEVIKQLNDILVLKLKEEGILKHRKLRVDTTVVESDIHHPTDATLLQDGVKVITNIVQKIKRFASHAVEGFEDKRDEIKKCILSIGKHLKRRTKETWEDIDKITQEVIQMTEDVCQKAENILENIKDKQKANIQVLTNKLGKAIDLTQKFIHQAKEVVRGNRVIPDRLVSFFDPEARPIKKGKLSKNTEFGYKLRIDETESGFVTGYEIYQGNPSDEELLIPAVENHQRLFQTVPNAVATDRGFSSKDNEKELSERGVRHISCPARGKKSQKRTDHEKRPWFQSLQRFRAAGEAKISLLKRKYGLNRSRYRGLFGSKTWVGFGILTHNLRRAAQMAK